MANYNFKKDLETAITTEEEFAKILVEKYNAEILNFEKTNKYDIKAKINGQEYTFEIKEDFMCEKTGNVCLEFECRGKISGINVSQADYYVYKLHTKEYGIQYIIYKTAILKQKIAEKSYFRIVDGGDRGSGSKGYLFKYDEFIKNGTFIDPLTK